MSNVSVQGIVLTTMPIGEYDRRLELLTGSFGRISVFAKGARKPQSDLVSASRVFAFGQFELYQGKTSYTMRSAKISNYFEGLTKDIDLTYYGFYFLELARYFSRENVESTQMLKLLYVTLRALERKTPFEALIRSIYELKILDLNGLCPPADELTDPDSRYSAGIEISPSCERAVRHVLSSSPEKVYTFVLSQSVFEEFRRTVDTLMRSTVDKKFRSLEFLD